MWRTCPKCKESFFRGGLHQTGTNCPTCKSNARNAALKRRLRKKKYETILVTNARGNVIKEIINYPEIWCAFCGEFKPTSMITNVHCNDCIATKPSNLGSNVIAVKCEGCGEMYWVTHKVAKPYCSPTCKEMLREHFECITCGERILSERPLSAIHCNTECVSIMKKVNRLREDRDRDGKVFNAKYRYNTICGLNVKESIIDEFRKDINEG